MRTIIAILLFSNYSFCQTDSVFSILDKKAEITNENYYLWHKTFQRYQTHWSKRGVRFEADSTKMTCIVEKNGKLSNCETLYSTNDNLTKLVLIVNNKYVYWSPAEISGKPVRSRQEIKMTTVSR